MDNKIISYLNKYADYTNLINGILINSFLEFNQIQVTKNKLILEYVEAYNLDEQTTQFLKLYKSTKSKFDFEDLLELFEIDIPAKDKVVNGAIYTPDYIRKYIISKSFEKLDSPLEISTFCDLSCGCGSFLITLSEALHSFTGKDYMSIYAENIYGIDITDYSIERSKILLSLFAIVNGEDQEYFEFNLFVGNSLDRDFLDNCNDKFLNNSFDCIVGNPPYVRSKNIDIATKNLLKHWEVTKTGNPDLYIPFFELGIEKLRKNGVLGYITVNTFFCGLNANALRNYLSHNKFGIEIYDFGSEQVFKKKSTYTCICFLSKTSVDLIKYTKCTIAEIKNNNIFEFTDLSYSDLDDRKWHFSDKKTLEFITNIENCGEKLGNTYQIKNGIATLANNIYIFHPIAETDEYYLHSFNGKEYKIEKKICRNIIKPNILKYEKDLEHTKEKIIFPYVDSKSDKGNGITICRGKLEIMDESYFQNEFPFAFRYLSEHKDVLNKRDKNNGNYGAWYAFGRTQALDNTGKKLLFAYIDKEPHFVFTDEEDLLIYCGYGIYSDSSKDLLVLKKILESDVFWYYIKNTSKPYSGNYYSLAKMYVKNFSLCNLTDEDIQFLEKTNDKQQINKFLINKYGLYT